MIFQQIVFGLWILSGLGFCYFTYKQTGTIKPMEFFMLMILGPGGWINLGLIGIFKKQFRIYPVMITEITFFVSLAIVLFLLYTVFPEVFVGSK